MHLMSDESVGDQKYENIRFVIGPPDKKATEYKFSLDCARVLIGGDGRVLEIKLMGVEKEVVDEMGLSNGG